MRNEFSLTHQKPNTFVLWADSPLSHELRVAIEEVPEVTSISRRDDESFKNDDAFEYGYIIETTLEIDEMDELFILLDGLLVQYFEREETHSIHLLTNLYGEEWNKLCSQLEELYALDCDTLDCSGHVLVYIRSARGKLFVIEGLVNGLRVHGLSPEWVESQGFTLMTAISPTS